MQNSVILPILLVTTISAYILQSWFASWSHSKKSAAAPVAPREENKDAA